MPIPFPSPPVPIERSCAVPLATGLADENPNFPFLNLDAEQRGVFFAAGGTNFGFHFVTLTG